MRKPLLIMILLLATPFTCVIGSENAEIEQPTKIVELGFSPDFASSGDYLVALSYDFNSPNGLWIIEIAG